MGVATLGNSGNNGQHWVTLGNCGNIGPAAGFQRKMPINCQVIDPSIHFMDFHKNYVIVIVGHLLLQSHHLLLFQMGSAMDALKYSGYMVGQAGLSSLYSTPTSSESLSKMYAGQEPPATSGAQETKSEYSADSLSRSYLEQQKAYYESAGLKGYGAYGGGGGGETKPYATDPPMSGRQSVESPDLKKSQEESTAALQSQQQAALQAYYSQSMGLSQGQGSVGGQAGGGGVGQAGGGGVLPPLLPMAAQLSQYAGSGAGGGGGGGLPGSYSSQGANPASTDYGRRPLSVLF